MPPLRNEIIKGKFWAGWSAGNSGICASTIRTSKRHANH